MEGNLSLNHYNLLNINTNANVKPTTKGGKTISSPDLDVDTAGHKLIAKVFNLNDSTKSNENLAKALMGIVVEAGCSIVLNNTSDAGTILEDVGQYIFDKQANPPKALSDVEVTMLQNLSIVLKVARKINKNTPGTFNCFTEFNRHSRYSYKDDGGNPQVDATAGRDGQDATSWTSFFKDALAFDAKQKGKANVGEIFKGGTPINDLNKHNELLKQFNPNESDYQSELNQFWGSSGGSGHDPASSVGSSTHVATNGTTTNTAGAPFSTPEEVRLKQQLEAAQQKIAELKMRFYVLQVPFQRLHSQPE